MKLNYAVFEISSFFKSLINLKKQYFKYNLILYIEIMNEIELCGIRNFIQFQINTDVIYILNGLLWTPFMQSTFARHLH